MYKRQVYNAANEEAASAFLDGRIRLPQIVDVITDVLDGATEFANYPSDREATFDDVIAIESEARRRATTRVAALSEGSRR